MGAAGAAGEAAAEPAGDGMKAKPKPLRSTPDGFRAGGGAGAPAGAAAETKEGTGGSTGVAAASVEGGRAMKYVVHWPAEMSRSSMSLR